MASLLLIPGIFDSPRIFRRMKRYLSGKGYDVHTLDIVPNGGQIGIAQAALQVGTYLSHYPKREFVLIGFSMGGIISRYYLQKIDQGVQVKKLITIGSPHRGTLWAYGLRRSGVVDMRWGSGLLRTLNADLSVFRQVPFLSIWTPVDTMIIPSVSSCLPNIKDCHVWALTHPGLVTKKKTFAAIDTFLQ